MSYEANDMILIVDYLILFTPDDTYFAGHASRNFVIFPPVKKKTRSQLIHTTMHENIPTEFAT